MMEILNFEFILRVLSEKNNFYFFIALLMFLNSSIQIPPSEYICLATGIIASANNEQNSTMLAVIIATFFNLMGTIPWYFLGKFHKNKNKTIVGRKVSENSLVSKIYELYTGKLNKIGTLYRQHGYALIFLLRNVPVIRSVSSYPAGFIEMPFYCFIFFSFLGILTWVIIWIFTGHLLGYFAVKYHWTISIVIGVLSITILKIAFIMLNKKIIDKE